MTDPDITDPVGECANRAAKALLHARELNSRNDYRWTQRTQAIDCAEAITHGLFAIAEAIREQPEPIFAVAEPKRPGVGIA